MDSTAPIYTDHRSLVTATLDSGFDSCSTSGNMSNSVVQQADERLQHGTAVAATEGMASANQHSEMESPLSTTSDEDPNGPKNITNRTFSAGSGSTFEIIDESPPSPTSYQLVEDSPVSSNGIDSDQTTGVRRNFPKLQLHNVPYSVMSPSESGSMEQPDNRYHNNCAQYQTNNHQSASASTTLMPMQTTTKTCEVDHGEERDTFSPISNNDYSGDGIFESPSTSNTSNDAILSAAANSNSKTEENSRDTMVSHSADAHNLTLPIVAPLNLSITNSCSNTSSNTVPIMTAITAGLVGAGSGHSNSGSGSSNNSDLDNKIFEKKKIKSTSTKEEKQRQNEEIVIMETSSVSSETGSWESVFPHHNAQSSHNVVATGNNYIEVKDIASEKFVIERENSQETPNLNSQPSLSQNVTASCPVTACFIDAASLLDESEVSDVVYPPKLPEGGCFGPKPLIGGKTSFVPQNSANPSPMLPVKNKASAASSRKDKHYRKTSEEATSASVNNSPEEEMSQKSESSQSTSSESWKKKLNLDKLETFHKSFELCKSTKPTEIYQHSQHPLVEDRDSSTSSCSSDSPHVSEPQIHLQDENTNNLSDEEKLWKRENSIKSRVRVEVKDQYNKESPSDFQAGGRIFEITNKSLEHASVPNDGKSSSSIHSNDINEEEIAKIRKEQERKQGSLVFQHNIQQFSGHLINSKIPYYPNGANVPPVNSSISCGPIECNNLSEYNGSPAPSLAWSDVETNAGRYANYDASNGYADVSDFGETSSNFNTSRVTSDSGATSVSCILPDTPHNSIVQIGQNTKVLKDSAHHNEESDGSTHGIKIPKTRCDDLAPIVSGGASIKDFTPKQCESPPVRRKTEACPIVSGGFVSLDFQSDATDDTENSSMSKSNRDKPKLKQQTWVVDMSDCLINGKRRRSTSSSSSTENTARSVHSSIERNNSGHSQRSGLGFYVSLNDMEPPKSIDSDYSSGTTGGGSENVSIRKLSRSLHESARKATGFYVDLSESENSRNATPPPSQIDTNNSTPRSCASDAEKKNIFSMFIDLGEKKILGKKGPFSLASRLSSSLLYKKQDDVGKSEAPQSLSNDKHRYQESLDSAGETNVGSSDESRKPSLLINSDGNSRNEMEPKSLPPAQQIVVRRAPSIQKDEMKRHSWNNSDVSSNSINRVRGEHKEHKRSASLSVDASDKNIMNILDKIPLLSKTSSMSIDSSLSPFDDITCSKTDLSTYSNNSGASTSAGENEVVMRNPLPKQQKRRRRDVKINETFDKSSQGSITDGILSKDLSPSTDTDDLTFQQDDHESPIGNAGQSSILSAACPLKDIGRPTIMETIIEAKETSSPKKSVLNKDIVEKRSSTHTMETLHATIEKQKMLLETVNEHTETIEGGAFVRLSDLDKPMAQAKFELHSPEAIMSKSVGNQRHINRLFQETTRNRPHSWAMTRSTGNSIMNITNSVENLRSLSRLFPHLSKEFSNSLPNDVYADKNLNHTTTTTHVNSISLMYQQRSPSDMDFMNSADMSTADSSLASSFTRSALDESSISCRQPRRLGEDLLKMFLQEIGTDVIVEVNGRRIKAHKCILRSRCQYFAAMLAGGWVQSAGNVISLQGYSYSSVHFALCHIYSGACHPPDGISLMELASLADLLGLEGLKEVTAHALKSNYCHNFHKPCSGCIDGILQVLPVALNHALDDLYRKCLKWTCRHYLKVWPTRSFAQLPSEMFNRCRQQVVAHLTSESVLQTILDCDQLIAQIAHFRWAAIIENLLRDILDAAYTYISDHFSSLIASDSFLSLGNDKCSDITQLENLLLRTASSLNPDQACRSYQRVTRLNSVLAAKVIKMPPNLSDNKHSSNVPSQDFGNMLMLSGTEEEMEWNEEFIRLVSAILSAVEQCLTRQCSRAMRVTAWQRMDLELRKKIQKLACLTEPLDVRRSTGITNINQKQQYSSKQISYSSGSRNQDLYQVKLAIQAHSKRALEQDKQLYRATAHTQTNTHDRNTQTTEKAVQAANHFDSNRNSTGAKTTKLTRAQIPQISTTAHKLKPTTQEKSVSNGHRRTLSEDSSLSTASNNVVMRHHDNSYKQSSTRPTSLTQSRPSSLANTRPTSLTNKLTDIRPRYLEPRKPRITTSAGPIKSQTNNNLQVKKPLSSSDSSRNSSPATTRKLQTAASRKIGTKSINMSLDSLASPSKRSNQPKSHIVTENEISVDSLADSLRSSIITEKTISHESLRSGSKNRQISRSNPGINNTHLLHTNAAANIAAKKPLNLLQTTKLAKAKVNLTSTASNTGSSPSSVTNKSSRLSSVSSNGFSPRDAFKNRSISAPASSVGIKKSFLSAKSREILARKAANLEKAAKIQQDITVKVDVMEPKTIALHHKVNSINKSSSSSNIPTRQKTSNLPQSIALKKKSPTGKPQSTLANNKVVKNGQQSKLGSLFRNTSAVNNKQNLIEANKANENVEDIVNRRFGKYMNDSKEQKVEIIVVDNDDPFKYESKLERSSTFCKEISDLPVNELEIID